MQHESVILMCKPAFTQQAFERSRFAGLAVVFYWLCRQHALFAADRAILFTSLAFPADHFMKRSMPDTPPFDPPYITVYQTADGLQVIETLADGTTRPGTAAGRTMLPKDPAADHNQAKASRTPTAQRSSKAAAAGQTPMTGSQRAALFLKVPFAEKDQAKSLGAKWDATSRKWYVPHGVDLKIFTRWWPENLQQKI